MGAQRVRAQSMGHKVLKRSVGRKKWGRKVDKAIVFAAISYLSKMKLVT